MIETDPFAALRAEAERLCPHQLAELAEAFAATGQPLLEALGAGLELLAAAAGAPDEPSEPERTTP
jgi:hypothetical protein